MRMPGNTALLIIDVPRAIDDQGAFHVFNIHLADRQIP
jgi:hypothetical protein